MFILEFFIKKFYINIWLNRLLPFDILQLIYKYFNNICFKKFVLDSMKFKKM